MYIARILFARINLRGKCIKFVNVLSNVYSIELIINYGQMFIYPFRCSLVTPVPLLIVLYQTTIQMFITLANLRFP